MLTTSKKYLLTLIGLASLLLWHGLSPSQSQDEASQAPFLYYYSSDYQAFIFERADGTESRLMGDGLMPVTFGTRNTISQSGWSSSGDWFAWVVSIGSNSPYGGGSIDQNAFVVSADGSQRLPYFDDYDLVHFAWSPTEDVLFAIVEDINSTVTADTWVQDVEKQFLLIDVAQGDVRSIWQSENRYEDGAYYAGTPYQINWTPDGNNIVVTVSYADRGWLIDEQGNVSLFSTENNIQSMIPTLFNYQADPLSPAFNLIYLEDDNLWVESVLDQTRQSFEPVPAQQAIWTNDGEYAFLVGETSVWLLSLPDAEITLVDEDMQLKLPTTVDTPSIWSPQGNHAILPTEDGNAFRFDLATRDLTQLDVSLADEHGQFYWDWMTDDTFAISGGLDYEAGEVLMSIYDLTSDEVETFDFMEILNRLDRGYAAYYGDQFQFTSDGQTLAYISEGAVLYNRENDTLLQIRPDYDSFYAGYEGEVYWNETEDWLFVHEDGLVASGGFIRHIGVLSADGRVRRDLGAHVNWLPPQVDPEKLPPVLPTSVFPQPYRILHDNQWNFYASWSPDGEQLAVGLDRWFGGSTPVHLWNLEDETVQTIFEETDSTQQIVWEPNADGETIPTLVEQPVFEGYQPYEVRAISPNGQQVVIWENTSNLQVFELEGDTIGELVAPLTTNSAITAVAYSPDGSLLAFGSQWTRVEIWDTQTWTRLVTLPNAGAGLAFSPDGQTLAVTISWDIQLWDVESLMAG